MSAFAVGEVAIGQNFVKATHRNGMEATITEVFDGELRMADGSIFAGTFYAVVWSDGIHDYYPPRYLRKRRPPASDESAHRQAMLDCIERAKRVSEVAYADQA